MTFISHVFDVFVFECGLWILFRVWEILVKGLTFNERSGICAVNCRKFEVQIIRVMKVWAAEVRFLALNTDLNGICQNSLILLAIAKLCAKWSLFRVNRVTLIRRNCRDFPIRTANDHRRLTVGFLPSIATQLKKEKIVPNSVPIQVLFRYGYVMFWLFWVRWRHLWSPGLVWLCHFFSFWVGRRHFFCNFGYGDVINGHIGRYGYVIFVFFFFG